MEVTAPQAVTVHLPDLLYRQVAKRAQRINVSLEDEFVRIVATTLLSNDDLPKVTID